MYESYLRGNGSMKFEWDEEKNIINKRKHNITIEPGQHPTAEQMKEVEEAKKHPITFDEDCEELSPAMMKAFRTVAVQRNRRKKA